MLDYCWSTASTQPLNMSREKYDCSVWGFGWRGPGKSLSASILSYSIFLTMLINALFLFMSESMQIFLAIFMYPMSSFFLLVHFWPLQLH
ncbi:hypothetical protein BDV37DRAFT_206131 [Aspergillus pseudonomiae]|uniref:Uncharacterized protein n=1 Tax=Aspergillus pseudonomiae TaxID=1506151 RepID=A0A5N7DPM9_9EURO|nr:uncharacterized protein BDV37DRAFT_206131 [Aspergillus pseudonomiae]KAE8407973.1 hypothetical protein BDV37DRAFT_206131 [Aspergillus pseudonomiae]